MLTAESSPNEITSFFCCKKNDKIKKNTKTKRGKESKNQIT